MIEYERSHTYLKCDRGGGDAEAINALLPVVYEELRALAAQKLSHERPGHTLQATALVHEAYLRLVGSKGQDWRCRTYFFAAAAESMRRILIDKAREKRRLKRGGDRARMELSKGYSEMQRIIREEEPVRPSTKVSTLGDTLTEVAKHRDTSPDLLCKLIRSDLDWIVMKTLEKDCQRRYESVSELAADVQRHLDNETVVAGRPSTIYRVHKFIKRNRTACIVAAAVTTILILAVIISTHQAWVARMARKAEGEALKTAEIARDEAIETQYKSLIREAHATRTAREARYRTEVFRILRQALELDVPKKNKLELRNEAVACLGDPWGFEPQVQLELPAGPNDPLILDAALHPTDSIAAFGLSDGSIILKDLHSVRATRKFSCEHPCVSLCFAESANMLLSIHIPTGGPIVDMQFDAAVAHLFVRDQNGTRG